MNGGALDFISSFLRARNMELPIFTSAQSASRHQQR